MSADFEPADRLGSLRHSSGKCDVLYSEVELVPPQHVSIHARYALRLHSSARRLANFILLGTVSVREVL